MLEQKCQEWTGKHTQTICKKEKCMKNIGIQVYKELQKTPEEETNKMLQEHIDCLNPILREIQFDEEFPQKTVFQQDKEKWHQCKECARKLNRTKQNIETKVKHITTTIKAKKQNENTEERSEKHKVINFEVPNIYENIAEITSFTITITPAYANKDTKQTEENKGTKQTDDNKGTKQTKEIEIEDIEDCELTYTYAGAKPKQKRNEEKTRKQERKERREEDEQNRVRIPPRYKTETDKIREEEEDMERLERVMEKEEIERMERIMGMLEYWEEVNTIMEAFNKDKSCTIFSLQRRTRKETESIAQMIDIYKKSTQDETKEHKDEEEEKRKKKLISDLNKQLKRGNNIVKQLNRNKAYLWETIEARTEKLMELQPGLNIDLEKHILNSEED